MNTYIWVNVNHYLWKNDLLIVNAYSLESARCRGVAIVWENFKSGLEGLDSDAIQALTKYTIKKVDYLEEIEPIIIKEEGSLAIKLIQK